MIDKVKLDVLERNAECGNSHFIDWAMHKLSDQDQLAYARKMKQDLQDRSDTESDLPQLTLFVDSEHGHPVLTGIDSDRVVTDSERIRCPKFWLNPIDHRVLYRRTVRGR